MTTMTTLADVRSTTRAVCGMLGRGYPPEEVDAMLDLAGRMVLEGSLASKEEVAQARAEMHEKFSELRVEWLSRQHPVPIHQNPPDDRRDLLCCGRSAYCRSADPSIALHSTALY